MYTRCTKFSTAGTLLEYTALCVHVHTAAAGRTGVYTAVYTRVRSTLYNVCTLPTEASLAESARRFEATFNLTFTHSFTIVSGY